MYQNQTYNPSELSVYFCDKENCLPGHSFGPTVRPHYLLHVILDGKGIYQYKGTTYHLKKGDAFLIPPMEITYYEADSVYPWSYAWVGFDGKFCKKMFSQTVFESSFVFENPNPDHMDEIAGYMDRLLNIFTESPESPLKAAGLLLLLFSCMPPKNSVRNLECASAYFHKAQEYIENNYSYPIKISDVARHVGIDRTYLYRIFLEQTNLSPKQYLLRHRIRIATEMLCSTNYAITEIALSCGFKDTSAFCNYFRQSTGNTPGNFRKTVKAQQ